MAGRGVLRGVSAAGGGGACSQAVLSLPFQARRATALNMITKLLMTTFKRQFTKCRQFFLSSPLVSGSHPASKYSETLHDIIGYLQRLNIALGARSTTSNGLNPAERCPHSLKASRSYTVRTALGAE